MIIDNEKAVTKTILLLGVVFAEELVPKRGQEFRDRVRCEALEKLGYQVRTLDNKHSIEKNKEGKHCYASFTDPRRMLINMKELWGKFTFDHVVLDYFFSPIGWARERWTPKFFEQTLALLASEKILLADSVVWLPNLDCTFDLVELYRPILDRYYHISFVSDPKENPLYLATDDVTDELLSCPDALTNETQLRPLLAYSLQPFIALKCRAVFIDIPTTPSKKRINSENTVSTPPGKSSVAVVTPLSSTKKSINLNRKLTNSLPEPLALVSVLDDIIVETKNDKY